MVIFGEESQHQKDARKFGLPLCEAEYYDCFPSNPKQSSCPHFSKKVYCPFLDKMKANCVR
jgi:hypothetical protein